MGEKQAISIPNGIKPSDLNNPIPSPEISAEDAAALDEFALSAEDTAALDQLAVGPTGGAEAAGLNQEVPQVEPEFDSPWYTEALPMAGGVLGGILGSPGGPAGMFAGATLGGAAGQGYREWIEQNMLGKMPISDAEMAKGVGRAALTEGAGQAVGLGIAKGVSKVANAVSEPISKIMSNILKKHTDDLEKPLTSMLAERGTTLDIEASGDAAKKLINQDIIGRYGNFANAYADLDAVAQSQPIQDEVRRKFTMKVKEWGIENHGGDNWRIIKKFTDDIDASNTGKQLDSVIGQISDAKANAFRNGANKQGMMLDELEKKTMAFAEGEVTKLAMRINAGKATPQEMQFMRQIMQQRGVAEVDPAAYANPAKYAKALAKDYLTNKEAVNQQYAQFRGLLDDIGEQAKVRAQGRGPKAFLKAVDEIPSEKLMERMFDPKNARMLRDMAEKQSPVWDEVSRAKIKQMIVKASPTGTLDLPAFRREVYRLPEPARKLLFSNDELKIINSVVDNPRFKRLESLKQRGDGMIARWAKDVAEVGKIVGEQAPKETSRAQAAAQQIGGRSAVGLGQIFYPGISEPQE